jgi:hypothetical protein
MMEEKHMTELVSAALKIRDVARGMVGQLKKQTDSLSLENLKLKFDIKLLEIRLQEAQKQIQTLDAERQDLQAVNGVMERIVKKMTKKA